MIPRTKYAVEKPKYEVDEQKYRRFPVTKQGFVTLGQKDTQKTGLFHWTEKMQETALKKAKQGDEKASIEQALSAGSDAVNWLLASYGMPNSQGLSWKPITVSGDGQTDKRQLGSQEMADLIKYTARIYGSDLTGIARLDKKWVYSEDLEKPFLFAEADEPEEREDAFMIPEKMDRAIVMAVAMNIEFCETSPEVLANTATNLGYSRAAAAVISLAEFIRSLGYAAIPCVNDTALSVPLAVDAGLGELGRLGLLITPEFGPCVRIMKILTDMPLACDQPVDFGIQEFCKNCLLCAEECPADCISYGEPTTKTVCENNNPGVKKWPIEAEKCLSYWQTNGTSCSTCLAVCPFTKGFESVQCVLCSDCDMRTNCSLQLITRERETHGYVKRTKWGRRPDICPLTREGL